MKPLLIFFTILFCININYSQNNQKAKLNIDGFSSVIYSVENLSDETIFKRINEWVLKSYNNPDEVIKSKIPNEYYRFDGYMPNSHNYSQMGATFVNNIVYTVTIDIKNGKYRLNFEIKSVTGNGNYNSGFDVRDLYNKVGERRKHRIYNDMHTELENNVNKLLENLYLFVVDENDDSW